MTKHPIIAKEGWLFVGSSFLLALAASLWQAPIWIVALLWLVFLFMLQFFRDPPRTIAAPADAILSPADGKVIVIEQAKDPYNNRDATRISVFMNVFNVHANRSPCEGTVVDRRYYRGSFLNAALDKASEQNERNMLVVKTPDGQTVTFIQIAGLIARRILCYADIGASLARGERYGFIRFGSRVDLYLPLDVTVKVSLGEKVCGGTTTLATFGGKRHAGSAVQGRF